MKQLSFLILLALAAPLSAQTTPPVAVDTAREAVEDMDLERFETDVPFVVDDPFEGFNRAMFAFNERAYRYVLRPVSKGYTTVVPAPARKGIGNFFRNLGYPVRFAGNLLQGRVKGALRETGAFVVDSTVGLAGFLRPSASIESLQTPSEDVGQALGSWGIGDSPFIILPLLGPGNPRDIVANFGEGYLVPYRYWPDEWEWETGLTVVSTLDGLPPTFAAYDAITGNAVDPYLALRGAFVQRRRAQVAE